MKIIVILFFLAICSNLYPQSAQWNAIDTTDIQNKNNATNHLERIALFANHYGIHVLKTQYTSDSMHVKYYRLKTTGELDAGITSSGIDLDDYGDFPNIVGDENNLYAVYRKNDTIKVQKSTDGGSNWSSVNPRIFSNGNVNCNSVDAAFNPVYGLHVVWSEKVSSKYESYFDRYDGDSWVENYAPITNTTSVDSGGFPTVTTSSVSGTDRAHFTLNTGYADLWNNNVGQNYSRDYDYEDWSNPVEILPSDSSQMDRLLVTEDDYIHSFYYKHTGGLPSFKYRRKLVTSSTWGNETTVQANVIGADNIHKIQVTKTSGDTIHAFWLDTFGGFKHRKKYSTSDTWSSEYDVSGGGVSFQDAGATSASNDLFVLYAQGIGGNFANNYKFRQYDDVPLAPQDLVASSYQGDETTHPKLTWTLNNEPDVRINDDGYLIERRTKHSGGGWADWHQIATVSGATSQYIDYELGSVYADAWTAEYRIRAKDLGDYISAYSSTVSITFGVFTKRGGVIVKYDYKLEQNFPNPFNPTTRISYSLAQIAFVTLKIYDVLGNELSELVNGGQTAGVHEISFDASGLSSGIYFYRVTAMNGERMLYSESKQMILLK